MSRYDLTGHSIQVHRAIHDIDARLTALEEGGSRGYPGRAMTEAGGEGSQLVEEVGIAIRRVFAKDPERGHCDDLDRDFARAAILKVADWLEHEPFPEEQCLPVYRAVERLRAEAEK